MTDRKVRFLVIFTAIFLLLSGAILFYVFDKQGMNNNEKGNYVSYNVNDYVDIIPVVFNEYSDVYDSINISRVQFKNLDDSLTRDFISKEEEIIDYITGYYNEIKLSDGYMPINSASSSIKTQINGAILSIFYRVDFRLDENIFDDNNKSYIITCNIDLATNRVLSNDDLLSKYDYTKKEIADRLFNEDVLVERGQVVIDKDTNISLTRTDIERKKSIYVQRINDSFDNIIVVYIDNSSLVLVYNVKDLKSVFFDNEFNTNVKFKFLQ